jgi:hypothetical protein
MTRAYIARQLLKHGPLTQRQFKEITGWSAKHAEDTIHSLYRHRKVLRFVPPGGKQYLYRLAA